MHEGLLLLARRELDAEDSHCTYLSSFVWIKPIGGFVDSGGGASIMASYLKGQILVRAQDAADAYEGAHDRQEILLAGVSTRRYGAVIGKMADTVGVSKSAVSREASERVLEELMERRLDGWDLLVIYLDGIQFGDYHVLGAVGVDVEGKKHVLGVREGASENAEVARALLGPGRAGRGHRASAAVCVGRIEGVEVGARPGVRAPASRPAVPEPQGQERGGAPAEGAAGSGAGHDAGGLEARGEGG